MVHFAGCRKLLRPNGVVTVFFIIYGHEMN